MGKSKKSTENGTNGLIAKKTEDDKSTKTKSAPKTKASKAGLLLSVTRVDGRLRDSRVAKRVGSTAAIYLAGVVETVLSDIIDAAGLHVLKKKKQRVKKEDLIYSIRSTPELQRLFSNYVFSSNTQVKNCSKYLLTKDDAKVAEAKKKETAEARKAAAAAANESPVSA